MRLLILVDLLLPLFSWAIKEPKSCDASGGRCVEVEDNKSTEAPNYKVTLLDGKIDLNYVQNLISESEVASLINYCDSQPGRWQASTTRSRDLGNETVHVVKGRISQSCGLLFSLFYLDKAEQLRAKAPLYAEELELSWAITLRVAELLQVDRRRLEAIQLLRYEPGGEYRSHHDHRGWYGQADEHERRTHTVLFFLQEPQEGGQLQFPYLNNSHGKPLEIPPRRGDAVYWSNVDANGVPDNLAVHAGMPVGEGQAKIVANLWVHEEPFTRMPRPR